MPQLAVECPGVPVAHSANPPPLPPTATTVFRDSPLFSGLSARAIEEIANEMDWVHLAGGEVLFEAGDPGDSLYIVLHGRLRILLADRDGRESIVREAGRGENVGEIALLTGEGRSATVRAVRDTELARLSRDAFLRIAERFPSTIVQLTRQLARWVVRSNHRPAAHSSPVASVAVLPHGRSVPASRFCRQLAQALARIGPTSLVSASVVDAQLGPGIAQVSEHDPRHDTLARWLDAQEAQHRFLVYEADPELSAWSRRCLRQADRTLHLASGHPSASTSALIEPGRGHQARSIAREEVVLLHNGAPPHETQAWLRLRPFAGHHHMRVDCPSDFERLARHLSGRAIGVALGGGGARGFAHIGVLRALREAGVPIDRIGGTSMGAVIAAQYAQGLSHADMLAINREGWMKRQPLRDFTLPIVALLSGRRGTRMLGWMFGDTRIEDLPLNYFAVSANLTTAEPRVHREGLVCDAVRASISIPGIAPPFVTESGELLVDGGVLNNVPADTMHPLDDGKVIAVGVSPRVDLCASTANLGLPSPWRVLWQSIRRTDTSHSFPSLFKILHRTAQLGSVQAAKGLKDRVDLYLEPPVGGFELFDWSALDALAEAGYRSTQQAIESWRSQQSFLGDDPPRLPNAYGAPAAVTVRLRK